jgi:DNA-binding transcriptional regulator LsrR (DeoR family)
MRQVREVLRLKHVAGHSERRIAAAIGISRYTVAEYLRAERRLLSKQR